MFKLDAFALANRKEQIITSDKNCLTALFVPVYNTAILM